MNTEQDMKKALDGWLFVYNCEKQKTTARKVSLDYIPSHKPKFPIQIETPSQRARVWTAEEDELLFKMFYGGYSFKDMAKMIGISQALANNRFRALCIKRGVKPERRDLNCKFDEGLDNKVAHMHLNERKTLFSIADELGLTRNQVCGIWRRWMRHNEDQQEQAA